VVDGGPVSEAPVTYAVADWDTLFEVDYKGREWGEGRAFRRGRLRFIRFDITNGRFAGKVKMIHRIAGPDEPYVLGILMKLLELVGTQERRLRERGLIRYRDDSPATVEQLAELLDLPTDRLGMALEVLGDWYR
jgi:hypothetical protein